MQKKIKLEIAKNFLETTYKVAGEIKEKGFKLEGYSQATKYSMTGVVGFAVGFAVSYVW